MVRPFNQLRKVGGRKTGHIGDRDPMKTSPVSGRLHSRNVRQLDKTVRRYPGTETPPFGMTGFEIGEFLATDGVDKKIVGLLIQIFGGTGKSATELFQLRDVHDRTMRFTWQSVAVLRRADHALLMTAST